MRIMGFSLLERHLSRSLRTEMVLECTNYGSILSSTGKIMGHPDFYASIRNYSIDYDPINITIQQKTLGRNAWLRKRVRSQKLALLNERISVFHAHRRVSILLPASTIPTSKLDRLDCYFWTGWLIMSNILDCDILRRAFPFPSVSSSTRGTKSFQSQSYGRLRVTSLPSTSSQGLLHIGIATNLTSKFWTGLGKAESVILPFTSPQQPASNTSLFFFH